MTSPFCSRAAAAMLDEGESLTTGRRRYYTFTTGPHGARQELGKLPLHERGQTIAIRSLRGIRAERLEMLEVQRVLDAIQRSARTHQWIEIA